jgi:hypothetical protein
MRASVLGFRVTMPAETPSLSVVLPAFNEEARLDEGLRRIIQHLRGRLWLAKRMCHRLREVPVRWSRDARSTVRVVRDGLRMNLDLLRLLLIRSLGP